MSLDVRWIGPAKRALNDLHPREAETVDAAVQRFARGEGGDVYQIPSDEKTVLRLRVGRYRVRMILDEAGRRLSIVMVYRADR